MTDRPNVLNDVWIPENTTTKCSHEPVAEREWAGASDLTSVRYVRVRLSDAERTVQWREVDADTLDAAVKVAEQMEDVEVCLEAKLGPPEGGWYCVGRNPAQVKQMDRSPA